LAASCWVWPPPIVAVVGLTARLVSVWLTVTLTLLVTLWPPKSAIVTVRVYAPAALNVADVLFDALVPFGENVGFAAPAGAFVAAHV
jgi:hypothetical protein